MNGTQSASITADGAAEIDSSPTGMIHASYWSHLVQHLYIGAAPLLFPLIMQDLGLSFAMIGLVISVRTFCAGFFQLFYGHLTRWFSRRAILNGTNAVQVVSSIGMGVSALFAPFLAFNVLWGLSTSPVHPIGGTLITDRPGRRSINIALFYSYAYVGNLLGAVLVTLSVASIGWQGVFVAMGLLTVPVLVYGMLIGDPTAEDARIKKPAGALILAALRDRRVLLACLVGILFFGGTNVFIRHLAPLYLTRQLNLSLADASLVFIAVSVIGIFAPPLFSWISERLGKKRVLVGLAVALIPAFAALAGQTEPNAVVIALMAVLALLAWPLLALMQSFLVSMLDPQVKGAGGDLLLTVNICSFILWSSLFGWLVDVSGSFDWTVWLIAGLCVVSLPLLVVIDDRRRGETAA